MKVIMQN